MDDQYWMQQALLLARQAAEKGEVPVGALIVRDDQLLGEGYNQPIIANDPSAHAEIVAIPVLRKLRITIGLAAVRCMSPLSPAPCVLVQWFMPVLVALFMAPVSHVRGCAKVSYNCRRWISTIIGWTWRGACWQMRARYCSKAFSPNDEKNRDECCWVSRPFAMQASLPANSVLGTCHRVV